MNSTFRSTNSSLRLDKLYAQLMTEDTDIKAKSKLWLKQLTFNTFKPSQWPFAVHYPHVQIGTRNNRPVYLFTRLDAIVTIARDAIPSLQALKNSRESLQDVELVVPFRGVDEWRLETSGGLSRGFRALIQYLLLLHAVEIGVDGGDEESINVTDLKQALMKCVQGNNTAHVEEAISDGPEASGPRGLHFSNRPASIVAAGSDDVSEKTNTINTGARSGTQVDEAWKQPVHGFNRGSHTENDTRVTDIFTTSKVRAPLKGSFTPDQLSTVRSVKRKLVCNAEDTSDDENSFFLSSSRRNFRGQSNRVDGGVASRALRSAPLNIRSGNRKAPMLVNKDNDYNDETDVEPVIVSVAARRVNNNVDRGPCSELPRASMVQAARKIVSTAGRSETTMGNAQQILHHPAENRSELQGTLRVSIESAAALYDYIGVNGIALIHQNTNFSIRVRRAGHPAIVPLGVAVGSLPHNANIVIYFHVVLVVDPTVRPAMTWFCYDTKEQLDVDWRPSSMAHDAVMAEINLYPIFQTWRNQDDFCGLLCLVVILASQRFLGGPYNHRIPIVQECRGQIARMLRKIIQARQNETTELERSDKLEAAQALLDLRTEPTSKIESLAGLRRATGADPGAILFQHSVYLTKKSFAEFEYFSIGVHIGAVADGIRSQQGQPVFAFISPQHGTSFTAPLMLTVSNQEKREWELLANSGSELAAAMAQIQPTPAFSKVQSAEDLLALVSLAILLAVEQKTFGIVNHMIPIVPWCRGHLIMMMRQALKK